jgi:hypothetical protein
MGYRERERERQTDRLRERKKDRKTIYRMNNSNKTTNQSIQE